MNAYPPIKYVSENIYHYVPHPIYIGFVLLCFGISILLNLSSGFWLISPLVVLGCTTLVIGYERHDLQKRFGGNLQKPLISMPPENENKPDYWNILSVYLLVFLPWLILYSAFMLAGTPSDSFSLYLPFEHQIPVIEWTESFYFLTYLFVIISPLTAKTNHQLRTFMISGLLATGLIILCFFMFPVIAAPRPFTPHTFWGHILAFERSVDTPGAAFPSFHVVWVFLAAHLYSNSFPKTKVIWYSIASLITISCMTTGMHAILDLITGLLFAIIVINYRKVWIAILRATEKFANSWTEWRIGKIRIINHGIYAGLGAFIGLVIVSALYSEITVRVLIIYTLFAIIGGALWAQVIEGSGKLLRPFGYYGSLIGGIFGLIVASYYLGVDLWLLLGVFAVASPFIQAIGRLRCLIQGCCHGKQTEWETVGIRYHHPKSRVNKIANLKDKLVYPTPLYSIIGNLIIGGFLMRLWFLEVPSSLITGLYLILAGMARFMEESYRGEPQTPVYARMSLYQWMAIISILCGIGCTLFKSSLSTGTISLHWDTIIVSIICGLLAMTAMGVDFPDSNKRFSRLTQ